MSRLTLSFQAWLWNGRQPIPGRLLLTADRLSFELSAFPHTHLQLEILYQNISQVEEFLVFDLARNGLRIQSRDGRADLFVVEDLSACKKAVLARLPDGSRV